MLTQPLWSVLVFLGCMAMLPFIVRRWKRAKTLNSGGVESLPKVVSAVAVGPQQRVVTIEFGPEGSRTRMMLGVTPQNINCLHSETSMVSDFAVVGTPVSTSTDAH
jgi:flagellar protein FliO/FliZ